jgi:hypothetical protein
MKVVMDDGTEAESGPESTWLLLNQSAISPLLL